MSNSFYHECYCLTKTQEEIIKPLLPKAKSTGRPALNPLVVFNAILWILSSGAAWRDLPPHYGNWNSIYHKFRSWCAQKVFDNILKALVADTDKYLLFKLIRRFAKYISTLPVPAKSWAIKQSEYRGAVRPLKFMLSSLKIFNSSNYY